MNNAYQTLGTLKEREKALVFPWNRMIRRETQERESYASSNEMQSPREDPRYK